MAEASTAVATLQSQDVVGGLGGASREVLATFLALFEDSTFLRHLERSAEAIWTAVQVKRGKAPAAKSVDTSAVSTLQRRIAEWSASSCTDDDLRLFVWMRLRAAYGLPASTFGTVRGASAAAEDLVAAMLVSVEPGLLEKIRSVFAKHEREVPQTLDALARQTLSEITEQILNDDSSPAKEQLLRSVRERIEGLDGAAREQLLKAIGADELNDAALRRILVTGGGLGALGAGVGLSGFSAYILAAQLSAFIPFVSGPALVSMVAVLSNPITIVLATAGAAYWANNSAYSQAQRAVALRVASLLALLGMGAGAGGLRRASVVFERLPHVRKAGELQQEVLRAHQQDWSVVRAASAGRVPLPQDVAHVMDAPIRAAALDRWRALLEKQTDTAGDVAAMSVLTVGELLHNAYQLDTRVLEAADFSRVEDLNDPAAFAAFAQRVAAMSEDSALGAVNNLKGYVAERFVGSQLVEQGHLVEFPATSNEAGWDIAVDGVRFQIKSGADLGLLQEHFDKGYEYPVIANAELAQLLSDRAADGDVPGWADQVHFIEGFSLAEVERITGESLDAGENMLHPHVLVAASLLITARQAYRFVTGQVTASQAVQEALLRGSVTTGLAVAGNFVGVGVGLLVFGPAGALVLGNLLPVLSRTQSNRVTETIKRAARGDKYRAWEEKARSQYEPLCSHLLALLTNKGEQLKARIDQLPQTGAAADYLRWRLTDLLCHLRAQWLRVKALESESDDIDILGGRLLRLLSESTLHPAAYQKELRAFLVALEGQPSAADNVGEQVSKAVEAAAEQGSRAITWMKGWLGKA